MSAARRRTDIPAAKERLWQMLDGAGSALISLKNRLAILERLCNLQTEMPDAEERDFALAALIDDIQTARIAVQEQVEAAYDDLTGEDTKGSAQAPPLEVETVRKLKALGLNDPRPENMRALRALLEEWHREDGAR